MKKNWLIWGITWILSIIGISFFGGNISYGIFAFVTAVPIVALLYLLYVYVFFRIYQEVGTRTLVAGHATPFFFSAFFFSFSLSFC